MADPVIEQTFSQLADGELNWMGNKTIAKTVMGGTATLIAAADPQRRGVTIQNTGTPMVYLGNANTVTTATGYPLAANQTLFDEAEGGSVDDWYGITDGTAGEVRTIIVK